MWGLDYRGFEPDARPNSREELLEIHTLFSPLRPYCDCIICKRVSLVTLSGITSLLQFKQVPCRNHHLVKFSARRDGHNGPTHYVRGQSRPREQDCQPHMFKNPESGPPSLKNQAAPPIRDSGFFICLLVSEPLEGTWPHSHAFLPNKPCSENMSNGRGDSY